MFVGRELVVIVGPQRSQCGASDLLDGIYQQPIIAGSSSAVLSLGYIVLDKLFEVAELAVRHEDRGIGSSVVVALANTEKFNARSITRQAFSRKLDIGKALEFDLDSNAAFQRCFFLHHLRFVGNNTELVNLPAQSGRMRKAVS